MFASIEARLIDVVVVYKIDWLSRSLMDFAKLVEVFGTALETGREGRLMADIVEKVEWRTGK